MTIKGFKSIQALEDYRPDDLTVLIGPNGAGKSNFISFFRMMSWALVDNDGLPHYVGQEGGASRLLHDGPDTTPQMEGAIEITGAAGENQYKFRLFFAAGDTLVFADEKYRFSRSDIPGVPDWQETGAGHRYPQLVPLAAVDETARVIREMLRRIVVYQFHNTSRTARVRRKWSVDDNRWLKEDAANLAPVLLRLKETDGRCYQRIVDTVQLILPFFSDFDLEPQSGSLLLNWRERGSDQIFSVSQASDGMLRVIALVTLLLQPRDALPDVLILDEPELGLHPYAIGVIGGLIHGASVRCQVIIATQSTSLVDCFQPNDIVVVEREGRCSVFHRMNSASLQEWLKRYSLSELWQKNVLGGRP